MDKEKKPSRTKAINKLNNNLYMTLKEIIREHALRYLPAKSLCRFKAVCKDWKLLISNPFFEHSQANFSRSLSGLFGQTPEGPISFISLDPMAYGVPDPEMKFLPEPVDLVASSNGLLCLRGRTEDKAYYICNPVNQQWKKLPKPEADHGSIPAVVLVFEPSLLKFETDYQLICAFPSPDFHDAYEFEMYSSTDNSWKVSPEMLFGERPRVLERNGVHLNGVVYWLSADFSLVGFDLKINRAKCIPCFDMAESVGVIDGKISTSRKQGHDLIMCVLSNVSGKATWERRCFFVNQSNMCPDLSHERHVLTTGSDLAVFHDGKTIFCYNLKTKETKSIGTESDCNQYNCNGFYVPCVNSLVSLH
ncbi:F-box protein At5g07610-like [Silene latifolia]|uniref:F-box protein At5g07610-like n=1 Tax=Silene latifolia TaxID=37657 RepID=UPI003D778479